MASSSVERNTTRAPPPPDQLAAFYKLVDKTVIAGVLSRHARCAELSAQAAKQAEALFGDSLAVASLRVVESKSLFSPAIKASGAEGKTLLHLSWSVLLSVSNLLLRRLADNTLLPGTVREEELDYEAHVQAVALKANNELVCPPDVLRAWGVYDGIRHTR